MGIRDLEAAVMVSVAGNRRARAQPPPGKRSRPTTRQIGQHHPRSEPTLPAEADMHPAQLAVTSLALLFLAAPALAETRVDRRQLRQEQRIDQGIQSGQLTGRETQRLEKGQDHVESIETRAQSGLVTGKEKARIDRAQDVQSRRIFRQKHDAQTR
jgi:hypothetical protein